MSAAGPILLLLSLIVGVLMIFVGFIGGATLLRSVAQRTPVDSARDVAPTTAPHDASPAISATLPADVSSTRARNDANPSGITLPEDNPVGGPIVAALAPKTAPKVTSASLVRVDENTGGSWIGRYGSQGYSLAMATETPHLPPGVRMTMETAQYYTWGAETTDPRALSTGSAPLHPSAGQWFWWDHFSVDLDLREVGKDYQVALYLLDWDTDARAQQLDVLDAASGAVLYTRSDSHFTKGRYVVLRLSGHVILRFTKTAGANATLSGVFFDP